MDGGSERARSPTSQRPSGKEFSIESCLFVLLPDGMEISFVFYRQNWKSAVDAASKLLQQTENTMMKLSQVKFFLRLMFYMK